MDAKQRQRLAVAHRVLQATRSKQFRSETLATSTGDHVFIPALPDDTMGMLFDQLRAANGPIHVAVIDNDQLMILAMVPVKPGKHAEPDVDPDDNFPVGPEVPVGILLDYLRLRDRPILCRELTPKVSLELVDGPRALCA
jgi:hypothetical protein